MDKKIRRGAAGAQVGRGGVLDLLLIKECTYSCALYKLEKKRETIVKLERLGDLDNYINDNYSLCHIHTL